MKIATKTLTTLLIITIISVGNSGFAGAVNIANSDKEVSIEKITRRHDRKLEIQAAVIGISPEALREELKTATFDQVIKKHGFKTREAFYVAVTGKLKDELKKRGWGDDKIQKVVEKRLSRLDNKVN